MSSKDFSKEEMRPKEDELGEEFIPHIPPTQTTSVFDDMEIEIKHENMDYHNHTSTSHHEGDSIPFKKFDSSSVKTEEKDLNYFCLDLDLIKCEQDYETPQPSHDPLHIDLDLLQTQQTSSLQVKCEPDVKRGRMEWTDEELNSHCEIDPNIVVASESDPDPDYCPSPSLTPNVRLEGSVKNNSSHKTVHTGDKPFKCHFCENSFTVVGSLNIHEMIHTGERPFKCDQCEKSFRRTNHLTEHLRTHTGEKLFKCDQCEKSYRQKTHLTEHLRIHTGEKPYECSVCKKRFAASQNLTTHIRLHTGDRPYKCVECEKSFTCKSALSTHIRLHTGDRPYKCDECEKSFIRKGDLDSHRRTHRSQEIITQIIGI